MAGDLVRGSILQQPTQGRGGPWIPERTQGLGRSLTHGQIWIVEQTDHRQGAVTRPSLVENGLQLTLTAVRWLKCESPNPPSDIEHNPFTSISPLCINYMMTEYGL